jgi:hypothetical protein
MRLPATMGAAAGLRSGEGGWLIGREVRVL